MSDDALSSYPYVVVRIGCRRCMPERLLIDLLRRMTDGGRAPSSAALPVRSVAALARKALVGRILDLTRLEALGRACAVVSASKHKGGQSA